MEKGWSLVSYFDKRNRAEMFKNLLDQAEVNSVIINKKGSELLVGSVEVYVKDENLEKAKILLENFEG